MENVLLKPDEQQLKSMNDSYCKIASIFQLIKPVAFVRFAFFLSPNDNCCKYASSIIRIRQSEFRSERYVIRYPNCRLVHFNMQCNNSLTEAWSWLWENNPFNETVHWDKIQGAPSFGSSQWSRTSSNSSKWPSASSYLYINRSDNYRSLSALSAIGLPPFPSVEIAWYNFLLDWENDFWRIPRIDEPKIIIEDVRARISHISHENTKLVVLIGTLRPKFPKEVYISSNALLKGWASSSITDGKAIFDIDEPLDDLNVYVLDSKGNCLDAAGNNLYSSIEMIKNDNENEAEIKRALQTGENESVEYKTALIYKSDNAKKKMEEINQTVVAFGNRQGGMILIGIENDLRVTGIEQALGKNDNSIDFNQRLTDYKNWIIQEIVEHVRPSPNIFASIIRIEGKNILAIKVEEISELQPLTLNGKRFYVRLGATNKSLEASEIMRALPTERPQKQYIPGYELNQKIPKFDLTPYRIVNEI